MTGTAVAAAAMAALTASQAPGALPGHGAGGDRSGAARRDLPPGDDSYHTELPPLESPAPPSDGPTGPGGIGEDGAQSGIPATVLAAYRHAERSLSSSDPGCRLPWELLAAIGKVESGQARGGAVDKQGTTLRPILGPVLNGSGFARITDTDGGKWDGDGRFDRAIGPMQFIPSTWTRWGADGNGDGRRDPNNVYDAALAAGHYLCAGDRDLSVKADLDRAVLSYNDSAEYLRTVLAWFHYYREGAHGIPDGTGPLPTSPGAGGTRDGSGSGGASGGGGTAKRPAHKGGSGGGSAEDGKGSGASGGSGGSGDAGGSGSGSDSGSGTGSGSDSDSGSGSSTGGNGGSGETGGSGGTDGGGSHESPSPTPRPTPTAVKPHSSQELTATTGEDFAKRPSVQVADQAGRPLKGVDVRFTVHGDTHASFEGDTTVPTGDDGIATAPAFHAGDKAGKFTVTAEVVGHDLEPVTFTATVQQRQPDKLTSSSTEAATAKTGSSVTGLQVKATYEGKATPNVALKATLLTGGGDKLADGKGPYFKQDNKAVHELEGLRTDANGQLTVPDIHTGAQEGTYLLRLTTANGKRLDVKLTVSGS